MPRENQLRPSLTKKQLPRLVFAHPVPVLEVAEIPELTGAVILERTGLTAEKYELWTVVKGKADREIKPTDVDHVKPGAHYRATIRGTDYSAGTVRNCT